MTPAPLTAIAAIEKEDSRAEQWRLRREAEASRDTAKALADAFKTERDHLQKVVAAVLTWAEQRCPCENEQPNPCPLCGASVENLEPCKSAENTIPRHLLAELRRARTLLKDSADANG